MVRICIAAGLTSAMALAAGGCLITSGKSYEESGVRVTGSTLQQIVPGETTGQWVVTTLGEPTSRRTVPDQPNVEILRYEFVRKKSEGGTVFLLFAGGSKSKEISTALFEVTDGVVTRHWTEP